MSFKNISFLIVVVTMVRCQQELTPLDKALKEIENSWTKEELDSFAQKNIKEAVLRTHFGYALNYRNKYFRNPKDSTLLNYFRKLNIEQEDYMSSIVFTSLHRKLNKKPIDLKGQLKLIYNIQDELKNKEKKNLKRALKYLSKYKIKDTIFIRRPIDDGWNAVQYSFPDDSGWIYNDSLDLLIKGLIIDKNEIKDSLDIFYKVKVLSKNNQKVKVLMKELNVNDTIDVNLRLDIIEDNPAGAEMFSVPK